MREREGGREGQEGRKREGEDGRQREEERQGGRERERVVQIVCTS